MLVVLAAGGAGVAAGYAQPVSQPRRAAPPPALRAAVAAERALLSRARAATGVSPALRRSIVADHEAHLAALLALPDAAALRHTSRTAVAPAAGTAPDATALRGLESAAAAAAADRATRLTAPAATLLASISACEATHAVLL